MAVSGALGRLEIPQGRHVVLKRAPKTARMDAAGTKIDAKWSLDAEKTNFVTQLSRESVSVCFSIDFWHFCKVGEASEVPRLSAKTKVWPFALWVALEPRKIMKIRRFQWPLDVRLALEWRFQEPLDVKLALERWCWGPLDVKLALDGFRDRLEMGSGVSFRDFNSSRCLPSPRSSVRIYV